MTSEESHWKIAELRWQIAATLLKEGRFDPKSADKVFAWVTAAQGGEYVPRQAIINDEGLNREKPK